MPSVPSALKVGSPQRHMEHAQDAPGNASVRETARAVASGFMSGAPIIGTQAPGGKASLPKVGLLPTPPNPRGRRLKWPSADSRLASRVIRLSVRPPRGGGAEDAVVVTRGLSHEPSVGAVIVNHNGGDRTLRVLATAAPALSPPPRRRRGQCIHRWQS